MWLLIYRGGVADDEQIEVFTATSEDEMDALVEKMRRDGTLPDDYRD